MVRRVRDLPTGKQEPWSADILRSLFEGLHLTTKYFFDAVGAEYTGYLTYRNIESKGDMAKHPTVMADVKQAVEDLLKPFFNRKVILFAGRGNNCRSQMARPFISIRNARSTIIAADVFSKNPRSGLSAHK